MQHSLAGILFDEQDSNLFLVDDARLRADALQHSVLPLLQLLMNHAIALIREIYDVEVLDDSIISKYPNFRTKRNKELDHLYTSVFVGLGGQRKPKWPGFARRDGKPVQILPFRYAFVLQNDELFLALQNGWMTGLSDASQEKLLRFAVDNESKVAALCMGAGMRPEPLVDRRGRYLHSVEEIFSHCIEEQIFDLHLVGEAARLPAGEAELEQLIFRFAEFYPVYDSYVQIAKDLPTRLDELMDKLGHWLVRRIRDEQSIGNAVSADQETTMHVMVNAAEKVKVMPALRWQVFQRDGWRCVSCGRTSHDDVVLHVDHITPRSLGGDDTLENLQTLCHPCNIGKSNRDTTNLRKLELRGS